MAENSISGTTMTFAPGERLTTRGEEVDELYIVLKGKVKVMTTYGTFYLGPGSIAGLTDSYYGIYIYNYFAEEETMVKSYPISSSSDIEHIIKDQSDNIGIFVIMQSRHVSELITSYLELNLKCREDNPDFQPDTRISKWELDKFNSLSLIPSKMTVEYYKYNMAVGIGAIYDSARFASTLNDICLQMADQLNINLDYVEEVVEEDDNDNIFALEDSPASILLENVDLDADAVSAELSKSLQKILLYSDMDSENIENFVQLVETYKSMKDRNSLSDEARQLRRNISKSFYTIYFNVFKKAVSSLSVPPIISMFLNFGYMDEELIAPELAVDLYKLAISVEDLCCGKGVYTCFTWLRDILWGEKEPSRNMLDMSYEENLRTDKRSGKISAEDEARLLNDNEAKVRFEIENMFTSANRTVYGRTSTFCPLLTDDNVPHEFSSLAVSVDKIQAALSSIVKKDFSAFYREIIYKNPEKGIDREFIMKEVMPNVILMPTTGTNGLMWQEIEGRRKDTPARFILPIFPLVNVSNILISLTGRYRWEMCKREQGARWNNLSEKSLTSEFYDYIQFYKRNRDLSEAAKDKIKSALSACRNNYREVFVKDYECWILYEASGAARLNKISRNIIATYCPFSKEVRTVLKDHPLIKESISNHEKNFNYKKKRLDAAFTGLAKKSIEPPQEFFDFQEFLNM